jgi:hypothetical protein
MAVGTQYKAFISFGKDALSAVPLMHHHLNQRRVPAPRGEYWYDVTVRRIIRSTTYIGDMVRKMGEQSFTFKVEPLVLRELWKAANDTVDQNKQRSRLDAVWEALVAMLRDPDRVLTRIERLADQANAEARERTL